MIWIQPTNTEKMANFGMRNMEIKSLCWVGQNIRTLVSRMQDNLDISGVNPVSFCSALDCKENDTMDCKSKEPSKNFKK